MNTLPKANPDDTNRFEEYMICKNRGHSQDPTYNKDVVYPKRTCKFCRTIYWMEEREVNVPMPPSNRWDNPPPLEKAPEPLKSESAHANTKVKSKLAQRKGVNKWKI